jgi:hypothetical protein
MTFPHLEAEKKTLKDLFSHSFHVFPGWESVIGGVNTDGFKDLGVLGKAIPVKPALGELASIFVTGGLIKGPAPPGVLPRGGADEHALARQIHHLPPQLLTVELHSKIIHLLDGSSNPIRELILMFVGEAATG